jgi:hypothetical protein
MNNGRNTKIFTIYTLGILNNSIGNISNDNSFLLINNWNNFLRENIINMIPQKYKINFIHCDILETPQQRNRLHLSKNKNITSNMNQLPQIIEMKSFAEVEICSKDREANDRIKESIFTMIPLDFEIIRKTNNYLIIDMAGVFTERNNINTPILKKNSNRTRKEYKNLNVVNLPYISNNSHGNYNLVPSDLAKTHFFTILDNGNVITYEQRLIQINYTHRNRVDKIIYLCNSICDQVLRNKNIPVIENSDFKKELRKNRLKITRLIINNLMDTSIETYKDLFNKSVSDIEKIFVPY